MSAAHSDSTAAHLQSGSSDTLFGVIDRDNVHGLNLSVPEDARELIKAWDERDDVTKFAESNVDDQMIVHVPFTQAVRLKSLLLKLGRGESTPRLLRVYANYPTIVDFGDAENTKPHLELRLLEGEAGVSEYPLRVAAFANVNSLSLFFSDASGGDVSRLYYLGFRGSTSAPKKDVNERLEIPAQNAADAPLVDRVGEKSGAAQTTAR